MKAYKVEILIVDHDKIGSDEIGNILENIKYPNWCISPTVMNIEEKDIGEWSDSHPLNSFSEMHNEYQKLFN